eukprot:gene6649-4792_t
MIALAGIVLLALMGHLRAQTCTVTACAKGSTCYETAANVMACLQTIPFNQTWAEATLNVLTQSLENFGFADLYFNTGPPYVISLDIQGELANTRTMVEAGGFATDLAFQEHVQTIFQKTIDAHTRYSKPKCYNAVFIQPFAFDMRIVPDPDKPVVNEPRLFVMRNLYTDTYKQVFPTADIDSLIGKEVLLLNGVEFTTEISSWGDTHETRSNNRGVRFNAAYRSYLYRSAASYNVVPIEDLTVTFTDGSSVTLPWMASYGSGMADVATCAAKPTTGAAPKVAAALPSSRRPVYEEHIPEQPLMEELLKANRGDRRVIVPANSTSKVSCFAQSVTPSDTSELADVRTVLVMKISSFSPEGEYIDAWTRFLTDVQTCITTVDYQLMVVDVMQNGGGYVCLGLRTLEMLVQEYYDDHTKLQMHYDLPHSKLMDAYIGVVNAPNPYPYPQDVEQILDPATQQSFVDGRAYYYPGRNVTMGGRVSWRTNYFALDCREAEALPAGFAPTKFLPRERLVILTDGTCGSTCASFTKIPQEADKATMVGAGGLWNENMDVSSFAGGFVCNPGYLSLLSELSNLPPFPKFLTDQSWQFGWAAWYSAKMPTRPVQFTEQSPLQRQAFWGFPHASIDSSVTTDMVSALYDSVIADSTARLAVLAQASQTSGGGDTCLLSDGASSALIALVVVFGVVAVFASSVAAYYIWRASNGRSKSLSRYGVDSEDLLSKA